MSLYQNSVINKYLKGLKTAKVDEAWEKFKDHFHNPAIQRNIRDSKEEQYQGEFLIDLFVNVFGYVKNPTPDFNLMTELKNVKGAKKTDGAILKNEKALAVIELKGTNTTDLSKVEVQAFGYKNNQPGCVYVITSNFEKLRFYVDNAVDFEEFNLFQLSKERFQLLWLCLSSEYLLNNIPKQIKDESLTQEETITKKLYKDYSKFRNDIFDSIQKNNTEYDKLTLFKKTQKLLDRFLFIFFAEDRLLLPPNSIRGIINQWTTLRDELDAYVPLYNRFKKYFMYMNIGYKGKKHDIFAYNGGLFAPDEVLDNIKIDDDLLYKHTQKISNYDFESEVSVNILGHIFEHSLNELEEIQATLKGIEIAKDDSKRKKDGVFYTRKHITKYIVDNTVGKICNEKKTELKIDEAEYDKKRKGRKKATLKTLVKKLEDYRNWLLGLTICDPACGSGAFLNQALEFLINEHRYADELNAKLLGEALILSEVENSILENNLFGVDINEESVEIAKLSLWLRTAQVGRKLTSLNKNIKCGNSLIDDTKVAGEKAFKWKQEFPEIFEEGGFDIIIGNPPYVPSYSIDEGGKEYYYKNYRTAEYQINLYGLFVERTYELIKIDSPFSLIIPNYWLSTEYDSNLRKLVFLENKCSVLLNTFEVFESATVDTLVLVGQKGKSEFPKSTNLISISNSLKSIPERLNAIASENWSYQGTQTFLSADEDVNVNFNDTFSLSGEYKLSDFLIFKKGMQPYEKGKGKPEQSREMMNQKIYHSENREDQTYLPLLKARNVKRYLMDETSGFVKYGKNLAAPRDPKIFTGERILLNRILSKKQIDGLYLKDDIINNSDVFNLIPKENITIPLKVLFPIIVSTLCASYFKKNNINLNRKAFPKINVNTLEKFPIPNISDKHQKILEDNSESLMAKRKDLNDGARKFERTIKRKFELIKVSKKLQNWYELTYSEFIKELKKQKIKLGLSDEAEWEDYFLTEKDKLQIIKKEIKRIDLETENTIFQIYNLTEEQISIVEEANA